MIQKALNLSCSYFLRMLHVMKVDKPPDPMDECRIFLFSEKSAAVASLNAFGWLFVRTSDINKSGFNDIRIYLKIVHHLVASML